MSAFVIVEIEVKNPEEYEEYKKLAHDTLPLYEGKYIIRGGKTEILEGEWIPKRLVVLEFPSMEQARKWWGSEEYAPAKAIRQRTANTEMILVEGFSGK